MHLIIDNYDSFTYNLFQYLLQMGLSDIKVIRNDKTTVSEIAQMAPEGIIISPGPGRPENAGISVEVVKQFAGKIPILGVCLGHQAIGYAFGARIIGANEIVHGKTDEIDHDGKGLFRNIPPSSLFTRYHSLVLSRESIPDELEITATSRDGEVMGVRHRQFALEGIQFHPESIASEYGKKLLKNFINYKREPLSIPQFLGKVLEGRDLLEDEASYFMEEMTNGELSDAQLASCLTALNSKKIKAHEIAGFASVLQKLKKSISVSKPLLDTCGTGGDGTHSFNISSMAAIVASACGACVAKHGNRSVSSKSGSADFYSELGIPIDLPPPRAAAFLEKTGFVFLFAPIYHGSMKHAARVRRDMGIKTVMNLMGPLLNPADAEYQLIGVFSEELCTPMAEAAKLLGKKRVMVVHSLDGFDEISVSAPTRVVELDENGNLNDYILDPGKLGIKKMPPIDPDIKDSGHQDSSHQDLAGGTPKENVLLARDLIESGGKPVLKEAVLLNTGAALRVYGLAEDIKDGYKLAKDALESGKVKQKLDQIVEEGKKMNDNRSGDSTK
jgi:anthranilate synthase/phosphoribosyltransferase